MTRTILILSMAASLTAGHAMRAAAQSADDTRFTPTTADALVWNDFAPAGFPPGAKIAVVHGNPSGEGPYTVRISLPDRYVIPTHWHGSDEHLTVISGTFLMAHGDRRDDRRLVAYRAGDFLYIPARHPHFGATRGPTVVQLHGTGPFTTTVTEPVAGAIRDGP